MPLTISHPAASIPLARRGLVLSALVIGSMTPDFPYFILFFPQNGFSHSIIGLFLFCIPVGLVSLVLFHSLIKCPALSLLPNNHQHRLYHVAKSFSFWPLPRFLLIILSIIWGAFTHILWDSFTHPKGWMVQQLIVLKSPIFTIGSHSIPIYEFLQHGSTIVGGILLVYWYWEWYKQTHSSTVPENLVLTTSTKLIIFIAMSFIALFTAVVSGLLSIPFIQTSLYYRLLIGQIFIVSISTFTLELVLFGAYWHFSLKKKNAV